MPHVRGVRKNSTLSLVEEQAARPPSALAPATIADPACGLGVVSCVIVADLPEC